MFLAGWGGTVAQHLPRTTFLDARFKNTGYLDVGVIEMVRVLSSDRSEES